MRQTEKSAPRIKEPNWTADEVAYLKKHAGILEDWEIGKTLGRTTNGVKVRRVRLGLRGVQRSGKSWLSARKVAGILDTDSHKVSYWCKEGLLPARLRRVDKEGRPYYVVNIEALRRWLANPRNWVYFDWRNLTDERIRRLCELRAERWGDEWWTTSQVAEHHGVTVSDVMRLIKRREIQSCRPEYSLGGRNFRNTWRNHFVLRSEATRADLVFVRGTGRRGLSKKFTPGFDTFLLKARDELGLEFQVIARMMKVKTKSAFYRYWKLKKEGR